MITHCQATAIVAAGLYIHNGWQSWLILGLTEPATSTFNMLRAPVSGVQRAAFYTVMVGFVLSWPLWMLLGHIQAWREKRAVARATSCKRI